MDLHAGQPQEFSLALALTEGQTVSGVVEVGGQLRGFIWTRATGAVLLPPLPGDTGSRVEDINSSGDAVGVSDHQDPQIQGLVRTPVLYSGGQPIDLTERVDEKDFPGCDFDSAVGTVTMATSLSMGRVRIAMSFTCDCSRPATDP